MKKEDEESGATQKDRDIPPAGLPIKGRFKSYNSPFLEVMVPLLTMRYVWLALEDINPLNFLNKPDPRTRANFVEWQPPKSTATSMSRNFASLGVGATMLGVLGYYSKNTYEDIRSLYAEAVGYELGKKPDDVTWNDLLFRSENKALGVTREAFFRRTLARTAAVGSFFVPWHTFRDFQHSTPKYDANVNAGVGALGTYLTLDGFTRKPSFFDEEQALISQSMTLARDNVHEIIKPKDIQRLLLLQRRHLDGRYQWPDATSIEGGQELYLAKRIADLLNQTYHNVQRHEDADLTIGKFNFLVGFGLLDRFPESLAFVELANRSADMREVKEASAALKNGESAEAVFARYGVNVESFAHKGSPETSQAAHADEKPRFASQVKPQATHPASPRSHHDFANQKPESTQHVL